MPAPTLVIVSTVSLMFAVATASSGLALVTEIDLGYFDKRVLHLNAVDSR